MKSDGCAPKGLPLSLALGLGGPCGHSRAPSQVACFSTLCLVHVPSLILCLISANCIFSACVSPSLLTILLICLSLISQMCSHSLGLVLTALVTHAPEYPVPSFSNTLLESL